MTLRSAVFLLIFPAVLSAVSPEARQFIRKMPRGLSARQELAIRRAIGGDLRDLNAVRNSRNTPAQPPAGVRVSDFRIDRVPARLYHPLNGRKLPLVIYLHGGGWTFGSINSCARFCGDLAASGTAAVLAINYRLAPEHPYPAALNDTVTAFREARRHLPETVDPDRIFLAGDSAGGHLAITAALKLADEFKQKPAGLILFYPVTTLEPGINGSWLRYGRGFTNDSRLMEAFQDAYCPNRNQRRERFVSPLTTDLSALPPFLLITAECDVLSDQGREFAERARRQGVRVIHEELPGAVHIFITMPGMEQAYRTAFEQTLSFLKQFPTP